VDRGLPRRRRGRGQGLEAEPASACLRCLQARLFQKFHAALGDVGETIDRIAAAIEMGISRLATGAYPYLYLANPNNHFYDRLRSDGRFAAIVALQKKRFDEESGRLGDL
jgi:hypothetical protein